VEDLARAKRSYANGETLENSPLHQKPLFFVRLQIAGPGAVAQPAPKFGGAKVLDFRRITLFCLEKRLSKHNMTIF